MSRNRAGRCKPPPPWQGRRVARKGGMLGPEWPRVRKSSFHSTRRCRPLDGFVSLRSLTLPSGWLFSFHTQMVLDGRCSLCTHRCRNPDVSFSLHSQMLPSKRLFLTPVADVALWMSLSHSTRRCCPLDVSFSQHSQMLPFLCLLLTPVADVGLWMSLSHSSRRCCPLDVSFSQHLQMLPSRCLFLTPLADAALWMSLSHSTRKCCPLDVSFSQHSQMQPSFHSGARRLNLYKLTGGIAVPFARRPARMHHNPSGGEG